MTLQMAADGHPDRVAWDDGVDRLSYRDALACTVRAATLVRGHSSAVFMGQMSAAFPITLYAAAWAGRPLVPLNYRASASALRQQLAANPGALVVADGEMLRLLPEHRGDVITTADLMSRARDDRAAAADVCAEDVDAAIHLYTSGTTAAPKAAVLRHGNLLSYLFSTVEYGAAAESECSLVCVPPYHIAGVSNVLSNVYACRQVASLASFQPGAWVALARSHRVTRAMVVPTMLAQIVDCLSGEAPEGLPTLRSLAYGGAPMPARLLQRALELLPDVGFVNAYGLTETSSTITVLTPEDLRAALTSLSPGVRARLGSVGRAVPGIDLEIRDEGGRPVPAGVSGRLWVHGDQVSGVYLDGGSGLDAGCWFDTRDQGRLDEEGYLFIEGRLDDVIIRGGENIAPAEIESVLLGHPEVLDAAVVGIPDDEWGHRIAAVIVPRDGAALTPTSLREWCRESLRSSKTPEQFSFAASLPRTPTGKLLRREVLAAGWPPDRK